MRPCDRTLQCRCVAGASFEGPLPNCSNVVHTSEVHILIKLICRMKSPPPDCVLNSVTSFCVRDKTVVVSNAVTSGTIKCGWQSNCCALSAVTGTCVTPWSLKTANDRQKERKWGKNWEKKYVLQENRKLAARKIITQLFLFLLLRASWR